MVTPAKVQYSGLKISSADIVGIPCRQAARALMGLSRARPAFQRPMGIAGSVQSARTTAALRSRSAPLWSWAWATSPTPPTSTQVSPRQPLMPAPASEAQHSASMPTVSHAQGGLPGWLFPHSRYSPGQIHHMHKLVAVAYDSCCSLNSGGHAMTFAQTRRAGLAAQVMCVICVRQM